MGATFTKAGEEAVTIGTIHAAAKRKEKKAIQQRIRQLEQEVLELEKQLRVK